MKIRDQLCNVLNRLYIDIKKHPVNNTCAKTRSLKLLHNVFIISRTYLLMLERLEIWSNKFGKIFGTFMKDI